MTHQPDTADTRPQAPKHYLLSLPLALKRIEELESENARLKKLLDRDHTGLASALAAVCKIANGYFWLAAGEWGSYECHERTEETLREEIGRCFEEIDKLAETALRESGTRADAAFVAERDKLATAEAEIVRLRSMVDALALRRREEVEENHGQPS